MLEELKEETRTIVMYEAPHRMAKTLEELEEILGNRKMTLVRELTKRYETAFRTTIPEALKRCREEGVRGECVLVIEGKSRALIEEETRETWLLMSLEDHMEYYESRGMDKKNAMKQVAKDRGVGKREIYQQLLNEKRVSDRLGPGQYRISRRFFSGCAQCMRGQN